MSQFPRRPRELNLLPTRLNRRLQDYARSINASRQRAIGNRQAPGEAAARIDWFEVSEEAGDYVVCYRRGDTSVTYQVAKPPDLQGAIALQSFGGEQHAITPPYTAGGILWGFSVPGSGGAAFTSGPSTLPFEWLDMNRDARQWARVPT